MRVALIGFGSVGRAFAQLLAEKRSVYPFRIVGAHTRSRGTAYSEGGLGPEADFGAAAASVDEFLDRCRPEVAVELTTLNPASGEPALSHIRSAFNRGIHVITANKGPLAFAYAALRREAAAAGVEFRFESVVMDGTPVFNMVRNTLPGVQVLGFAGALNSTSKIVLEAMERGLPLEDGIAEAQRLGITEADPWFDLDGWDSACKAAALANVLMDADVTPSEVDRRGIGRLTPEKLEEMLAKGKRPVLVCRAKRTPEGVRLRVRAEVLGPEDILSTVRGTSNLLLLQTDLMGEIGVFSLQPGVRQTAYGVFSDLVDIAKTI